MYIIDYNITALRLDPDYILYYTHWWVYLIFQIYHLLKDVLYKNTRWIVIEQMHTNKIISLIGLDCLLLVFYLLSICFFSTFWYDPDRNCDYDYLCSWHDKDYDGDNNDNDDYGDVGGCDLFIQFSDCAKIVVQGEFLPPEIV